MLDHPTSTPDASSSTLPANQTRPTPTVGVVGLGFGRAYITAFQANHCRVVAVCQRDVAAARTVAAQFGIAQVYDDWDAMLRQARPDILVIATPPHLHHQIALSAFDLGVDVLCEKPLATNIAQAIEMAGAARRAGRIAMTGFNWRFAAAFQALQSQVRDGSLGRIHHVTAHWRNGRMAGEDAPQTWRTNRELAGFGAMGDSGVHLIDMISSTFGEFSRLVAHAGVTSSRRTPDRGPAGMAEDYCTIVGTLVTGIDVTITVSRAALGPTEHGIDVYGSRAAARFRQGRAGALWWDGELTVSDGGPPVAVTPAPASTVWGGEADSAEMTGRTTASLLARRFLDAIVTRDDPSPSFDDGVRAQVVLDAVSASLSAGAWVPVSAQDPSRE